MSDAILNGDNPYATYRYNYAPTSAYLISSIRWLQETLWPTVGPHITEGLLKESSALPFHLFMCLFLCCIDGAIAYLLKHFNPIAAIIFLLHPAIILLTGFHSQIENLGILFLLLSIFELKNKKRFYLATIWMILSLQMKHLAIFFPIWMLFRSELNIRQKGLYLSLPLGIFFLSFQPFLLDPVAREALNSLTFRHSSFHLSAFWPTFFDAFIPVSGIEMIGDKLGLQNSFKLTFFSIVLLAGYYLRNIPLQYLPILYCAIFTTFASGIADQYLMIPMVYMAVFWRNPFTLTFGLLVTMLLCASHYNIGSHDALLEVNRLVRGLGWMRWHPLAWIFVDLIWRLYESWRQKNTLVFTHQIPLTLPPNSASSQGAA